MTSAAVEQRVREHFKGRAGVVFREVLEEDGVVVYCYANGELVPGGTLYRASKQAGKPELIIWVIEHELGLNRAVLEAELYELAGTLPLERLLNVVRDARLQPKRETIPQYASAGTRVTVPCALEELDRGVYTSEDLEHISRLEVGQIYEGSVDGVVRVS